MPGLVEAEFSRLGELPGVLGVVVEVLVLDGWDLTLYVVGRKSGKRYTVPMAYVRHEGALLLGSGFSWAKNLRTGEPVELRYQGRRRTADVDYPGVQVHA